VKIINGKEYKLLLCDTNIISEFLINKKTSGKGLIEFMLEKDFLLCLSFSSITELYYCTNLFGELFKYIPFIPFLILKNFNQLLEEEISNYPNNIDIDSVLFCFKTLQNDEYYEKAKNLFYIEPVKSRLEEENKKENKEDILKSMLSWIEGYPRPKNGYKKKDIELWVELVNIKKLVEVNRNFVELNKKNLNHHYFKSWKMIAYMTFYKFYLNNKKPETSDLGDILMSANFPYVDAIIVEKNIKEIVRQVQRKHKFVNHLELYDINSIKN
jgi:hypothetical protein